MVPAVFLDRDGVINRKAPEGQYITRWEQVSFFPGAAEAVRRFHGAGFLVVLVTNQRAVAKGLISGCELESLHSRMWHELFGQQRGFDAVYYCPHETTPPCDCRKPEPGMLLAAARDLGIALAASWMVGDSESDVIAGQKAGCRTVRIGPPQLWDCTTADEVAVSLFDSVHRIVSSDLNAVAAVNPTIRIKHTF